MPGDCQLPSTTCHDLVLRNRGVAVLIWRKYRAVSARVERLERDDALQAAFLGLCRAARTFDPAKGKFTVWCKKYVRHALAEAADHATAIRTPYRAADCKGRYDEDRRRAVATKPLPHQWDVAADRPGHFDDDDVRAAVARLPGELQTVVRLRYEGDLTYREIGLRMGVSHEAARQFHFAAITKLRSLLGVT